MPRRVRPVLLLCSAALLLAAIGYAVFWPSWIEPEAWSAEPDPGLTGVYAPNGRLDGVERLAEGVDRPEDVELGPDGWLYASLHDGRIIRFHPQQPDTFEVFAHTRGFPIGLEFDANGNLIVADSDRGLLAITPRGDVRVLLDELDGKRMRFPNDVSVARDGTIWFSDSYSRGPASMHMQAWEGVASGRLIAFDPADGTASVRVDSLMFANGVTLGPSDAYVLVTELFGARVIRYWLTGPRRGTQDVFLRALPGYPDNITFDGGEIFWLPLVAPRAPAFERWSRYPVVRQFVAKAPLMRIPHPFPSVRTRQYWACVIGVDTTGVVRHNLQSTRADYGALTSANAYDGRLYLGSFRMTAVGRVDLRHTGEAPGH